jgi:hypothetical protein
VKGHVEPEQLNGDCARRDSRLHDRYDLCPDLPVPGVTFPVPCNNREITWKDQKQWRVQRKRGDRLCGWSRSVAPLARSCTDGGRRTRGYAKTANENPIGG